LSIEGERRKVELARGSEGQALFAIDPQVASPNEVRFVYRLLNTSQGELPEREAVWNAEQGVWLGSGDRMHPLADFKMEFRIERGTAVLWEGRRWAYGEIDHHHH
jgi:hypothetical protein